MPLNSLVRRVCRKENIIFLRNSGTGKTHLGTGLGIAMIENGYKANFITASDLAEELLMANQEHLLSVFEKRRLKFDVIALAQFDIDKNNKKMRYIIVSTFAP